MSQSRSYVLISPGRNEAAHMRRTLDSVIGQTVPPDLWVIVDDGSTDESPEILAQYSAEHPWIRVLRKPDRGARAVGPGVIEAFYFGLNTIDLGRFSYLCKLDLDLELPDGYFAGLMDMMESDPRLGTCSGKPYYRDPHGALVSEGIADDMSVGMTKFYRTACFQQIGGFVQQVMWDGIDCHKARQLGWRATSTDRPDLRFEHLRPMGSSQTSVMTGRRRHGFGQYFMGTDPLFLLASAVNKLRRRPYVIGSLAIIQGYLGAWMRRADKLDDPELRRFIRSYQRSALLRGKRRAMAKVETAQASVWSPDTPGAPNAT